MSRSGPGVSQGTDEAALARSRRSSTAAPVSDGGPPVEADWDAVLAAADAACSPSTRRPTARVGLRYRRAFDGPGGVRRHHVAVAGGGRLSATAPVELATAPVTRAWLFVTTAPALLPSVGHASTGA